MTNPFRSDNFNGEEIGSSQNIQMSADEVFPSSGVLSLGSGRDVMTTQDIADGLVRQLVAKVG